MLLTGSDPALCCVEVCFLRGVVTRAVRAGEDEGNMCLLVMNSDERVARVIGSLDAWHEGKACEIGGSYGEHATQCG